jgi:peptidyl-prolyl cis-trans isomerase C
MQAQLPTATPSATPIPLAISLDGEGIAQEAFQRELQRFLIVKESLDQQNAVENPAEYVVEQLIDQQLLLRAAKRHGCTADEEVVQQDWDQWLAQLPEGQTSAAWLEARGYTEEEFRTAIATSILVNCQVLAIKDTVPYEAEQIRASQILVKDRTLTDGIISQLNVGVEFATLAYQYDPLTGGDLGWFPKGYLLQPAVDEAVFALQPGEFTPVVETELGYHIVYVYERAVHPLSIGARQTLQHSAVQDWLQTEREKTNINISLPE